MLLYCFFLAVLNEMAKTGAILFTGVSGRET